MYFFDRASTSYFLFISRNFFISRVSSPGEYPKLYLKVRQKFLSISSLVFAPGESGASLFRLGLRRALYERDEGFTAAAASRREETRHVEAASRPRNQSFNVGRRAHEIYFRATNHQPQCGTGRRAARHRTARPRLQAEA